MVMIKNALHLLVIGPSVILGCFLTMSILVLDVSPRLIIESLVSASANFQALGAAPAGELLIRGCADDLERTPSMQVVACENYATFPVTVEEASEYVMGIATWLYVIAILIAIMIGFVRGRVFPYSFSLSTSSTTIVPTAQPQSGLTRIPQQAD